MKHTLFFVGLSVGTRLARFLEIVPLRLSVFIIFSESLIMSEKVKGNVQDSPNANLLAQPLNAAGKILTVAEKSNIATKAPTNQGSVNAADLNGNDEIKVEVVQGENVQTSDDSSGSSSSSSKKD